MQLKALRRILTTRSSLIALLISAERILVMQLLINLFSTDYGLQSLAVIVFILGMFVWFGFYFKRHMDQDAKNAGK